MSKRTDHITDTLVEQRLDRGKTYTFRDGQVHPKIASGYTRKTKQVLRRRKRQAQSRKSNRRIRRKRNGLKRHELPTEALSQQQKEWNESATGIATWEKDKGGQEELRLTHGEDRDLAGAVTDAQLELMTPEKREEIESKRAEYQTRIEHRAELAKIGKCVCRVCVRARQIATSNHKSSERRGGINR